MIVDERRFVQVATVANVVARAENCSPWRALVWLAGQVEAGKLSSALYIPDRTEGEERHCASAEESIRAWRDMARRATEQRHERDRMPTAASTWFMHIDDVARLLRNTEMGDPLPLQELVHRHSRPQGTAAYTPTVPTEPAPLPPVAAVELVKALLNPHSQEPAALAALALNLPESADARERRRYDEFLQGGGIVSPVRGGGWTLSGKFGDRGALIAMAEAERMAGRQYTDPRDVSTDIKAEAERRRGERAMPRA